MTVPAGWVPVRLDAPAGELVWCEGDDAPTRPFYETTLFATPSHRTSGVAHRARRELRTAVTPELVAGLEAEALPLSGFVLHLSRSGSTVVAASLAAQPGVRVLNEPDLLDQALTAARAGHDPQLLQVRAVLAALGRPSAGLHRYVIKTDAWHALALAQLRQVRPDAAWLFVYRDPAEVLASHQREPGAHTVPGILPTTWFGVPETVFPAEYAVQVLGAICAAIVPHAQAATLLNYAELPTALTDRVPHHFGFEPLDQQTLATVTDQHAKRPYEPFVAATDAAAKRDAISGHLSELLERWVTPHYLALERVRHDASR